MNVKWFSGSLQGQKAGLGSEHRRAFRVLPPSPGHREELRRDPSLEKARGAGVGAPMRPHPGWSRPRRFCRTGGP